MLISYYEIEFLAFGQIVLDLLQLQYVNKLNLGVMRPDILSQLLVPNQGCSEKFLIAFMETNQFTIKAL